MEFKNYLNLMRQGQELSFRQAADFQNLILSGRFEEKDLISAFEYLEKRPLTYDELEGFYQASALAMVSVVSGLPALDTCGTGGDNSGSFNISTAAALICSAAGAPVAKHGNRAASSQCGSADVLEELGVNIDLNKEQAEACLKKCGFVFLMAKNFHPAFRFAAPARKVYGKRTYFNLLGPLLNPAKAVYRVHGFSDPITVEFLGKILVASGVKMAWLVNSSDGLDEISPAARTKVWEFTPRAKMKIFEINPDSFGFSELKLSDIKGGDAKANAQIILSVLNNEANESQTACALLNAGAGLVVCGKAKNLEEGLIMAKEAITSGKAMKKLQEIIKVSQSLKK